ncbi:oligosaccharide flippase family protein [Jannaschia sp. LMIT008]|uniref:oligosaccharide flippase family protein n=1 Tax=Jannaschia maritima TaxID=3032585 RepID=UPI0028110200|nr:oligosaccharide flippase family protein [Jannaschia sp. LMIT008]
MADLSAGGAAPPPPGSASPPPGSDPDAAARAERGRTFRRRSLSSLAWTLGGTGLQRSLSLVSNLILTRLLMPEAFGLMAVVVMVGVMIELISDIGVRQSVIRSERGEERHFLRVAWTVRFVRGLFVAGGVLAVAGLLWLLAPALAPPDSVYADPRLPALIAVSALTIVLGSAESIGVIRDARRMNLRRNTVLMTVSHVVTFAATLGAVLIEPSVWALVIGTAIGTAFRVLASHALHRDLVGPPVWDRAIAAEMWTFGRWIIGSSVAFFILSNGGRLILGALLDARAFGLFAIAMLWVQSGVTVMRAISNSVIFSAFAETLRDRRDAFPALLGRARAGFYAILALGFACALGAGDLLIRTIYPEEYYGASVFLILMSVDFLIRQQSLASSILLSEGRSAVMAVANAVAVVVMIAGMLTAWRLAGPNATVLAMVLAPLAAAPILFVHAKRAVPAISIRWDMAMIGATLAAAGLAYLLAA